MTTTNKSTRYNRTTKPLLKMEWQRFIDEMNVHGDKARAYMAAYPKVKDKHNALIAAIKLLKNPKIYQPIQDFAQEKHKLMINKMDKAIGEDLDKEVLTYMTKRQILFQIASGTMSLNKISHDKLTGAPILIETEPDHLDRIRAIDIDNKMSGEYLPGKKPGGAGGDDDGERKGLFDHLSTEDIKEILGKK